jgi:hypothetical protein
MKRAFLMAAMAAAAIRGAAARAAELPRFELAGFPITSHQTAVLGGGNVREQSPVAMVTMRAMPASPHQIAVLTPRPGKIAEAGGAVPAAGIMSK